MKDATPQPVTIESIDDLSRLAASWIERREFANWSDADQAEFDAWISASPAHRIAFLRLEAGWKRTELLGALRPLRSNKRRDPHIAIRAPFSQDLLHPPSS